MGIHQGARLCPLCTCSSMVLAGNSISLSFLTSKQGSTLVQILWRPSSPLGGWLCGDLKDGLASVTCKQKIHAGIFGSLFFPWSLNYSMCREAVSLNIKCGELTVASLMDNSQSDSQELTGKTSLLDWWGCCQGFLFLIFDSFSLPTIQELQAQAVLFFSRKMNLFPWNKFVSEGSFWCLSLSFSDARKLQ